MILTGAPPGSSIALIAPSSPFDPGLYEKGRQILEGAGYRTVTGKSVKKSMAGWKTEDGRWKTEDTGRGGPPVPDRLSALHPPTSDFRSLSSVLRPSSSVFRPPYLAGSDLDRMKDLRDALLDPEIQAVICIRGGYGSGRLLPSLPFETLRKCGKIFLGHSDVTFLHLAFAGKMSMCTLHGPNLTGLADEPERAQNVIEALSGRAVFEWKLEDGQVLRHGTATGPVLGGNLTCLAHLVGTPYLPDMTGALLLIEDCGEALYRLDRIVNHLRLAGILQRLGAIILGEFDRCAENEQICAMVMDHARYFDFPVVHGLPFGHGRRNEVIPFGVPFLLDTHESVLRILQDPIAA